MSELVIRPTDEQAAAWEAAASGGGKDVAAWLAELADETLARNAEGRTFPYVVKLKHVVSYDDEPVSSLTFRRGTLADAKGLKLAPGVLDIDKLLLVASRLCGQPVRLLEALDVEDGGEVMDIAMTFFVRFLQAGTTG